MKKVKLAIFTFMAVLIAIALYAQHTGEMGLFSKKQPPVCGGYTSKKEECKSMENEKGTISSIFLFFYDEYKALKIESKDDTVKIYICSDTNEYLYQEFPFPATDKTFSTLTNLVRKNGLLKYNGWGVHVSGLPLTTDCTFSMKFTSGNSYYMEFNGGHSPMGFYEDMQNFVKDIKELVNFDEASNKDIPPYVSPFWGTHKFVYEAGGKKQTIIYSSDLEGIHDNIDLKTYGDFYSYQHIHCSGHKIHSGQERYDLDIEEYFEDSEQKPSTRNSTAAIIYQRAGKLEMEVLQVCPSIAGKDVILKEIEKE